MSAHISTFCRIGAFFCAFLLGVGSMLFIGFDLMGSPLVSTTVAVGISVMLGIAASMLLATSMLLDMMKDSEK